jgi:hypothetical protein
MGRYRDRPFFSALGAETLVDQVEIDPAKRYHLSQHPIPTYRGTVEQGVGTKPKGLWYACGDEWLRWMEYEMPQWLADIQYIYEVFPGPDVLYIRTVEELDAFNERFGVRHWTELMGLRDSRWTDPGSRSQVDWEQVAHYYSGIEICPYRPERRLDGPVRWYYGWDVASGCLWGPDLHSVELIARTPGAS